MLGDIINALFELSAGFLILNNCRILYNDKTVRGVSIFTIFVFTIWGCFHLLYYPSLNQWLSFAGGILVVAANTLWVYLEIGRASCRERV